MSIFTTVILTFAWLIAAGALAAEPRTWTDLQGRQIEATLVEVEGENVTILRDDGHRFTVPVSTFSEQDRAYVREWNIGPAEWPPRVQTNAPRVEIVEERRDNNIYRTEHFEFHSDTRLSRTLVTQFGQIFEATFAAVQALPLGLDITAPEEGHFKTRLFADEADYHRAGGIRGSGGIYDSMAREILVPIENLGVRRSSSGYSYDRYADNSTLIHEIVHQVMHPWLEHLPAWLAEGIAVYMETIPYRRGLFQFRQQDLQQSLEKRMGAPGESIPIARLEGLMNLSYADWSEGFASDRRAVPRQYITALLLTHFFLHLDGDGDSSRIIQYIRSLRSGQDEAEARQILLNGRTIKELEKELVTAFNSTGIRLTAP